MEGVSEAAPDVAYVKRTKRKVWMFGGVMSAMALFLALGVSLLIVGPLKYFGGSTVGPAMVWSVSLCEVSDSSSYSGNSSVASGRAFMSYPAPYGCPLSPVETPQTFIIPPSVIVHELLYLPFIYVSHGVTGYIAFSTTAVGQVPLEWLVMDTTSAGITRTNFTIPGGSSLVVLRKDALDSDGIYDTASYLCNDTLTGCPYEIVRSLDKFVVPDAAGVYISSPDTSVELTIHEAVFYDTTRCNTPEVYIGYEIVGRTPQQQAGLALCVVGLLLCDLMPASLFFTKLHIETLRKKIRRMAQGIQLE
ncbi:hypothetical protein Pelo_3877 [Pelomyxa schiedti]|nr:hypothetical protein Pelo_3877 [Pelomyxa schiedti]